MDRRVLSTMAALALTLGLSTAATEGASASAPAARGFLAASSVPWASLGRGWVLAQWDPRDDLRPVTRTDLVLVSPTRTRYLLGHAGSQRTILTAWSGDGASALLVTQSSRTTFQVLDLRSGATTSSFAFPASNSVFYEDAAFTRPDGLALLVRTQTDDHQLLARYSLTGQLEQTYPWVLPGVGAFTGGWLSAPDGSSLVLGAIHGLAIVSNAGVARAELRAKHLFACSPLRWWSGGTILASCGAGAPRLYEFFLDGAAPRALTQRNVPPDDGDLSAWRLGRSVYVQVASACGYEYLAKLHGADPVMVQVPGVREGHTVYVVGTTSDALALEASVACQPGLSLLYYDPAAHRAPVALGRPTTSGSVLTSLVYPPPGG